MEHYNGKVKLVASCISVVQDLWIDLSCCKEFTVLLNKPQEACKYLACRCLFV